MAAHGNKDKQGGLRGARAPGAGTGAQRRAGRPAGAGKTTLAEALVVATGALNRAGRVEDGTTCLDTDEVEVRLQHSVTLHAATVEHDGHRITLLDTPGAPDFVGELRAALRAADAALFVVSAVSGVDAGTVQLWDECAAVGLPRAVVRHPGRPAAGRRPGRRPGLPGAAGRRGAPGAGGRRRGPGADLAAGARPRPTPTPAGCGPSSSRR